MRQGPKLRRRTGPTLRPPRCVDCQHVAPPRPGDARPLEPSWVVRGDGRRCRRGKDVVQIDNLSSLVLQDCSLSGRVYLLRSRSNTSAGCADVFDRRNGRFLQTCERDGHGRGQTTFYRWSFVSLSDYYRHTVVARTDITRYAFLFFGICSPSLSDFI